MKLIRITICFLAVLIAGSALAAVHHVPEEYATIQAAIDACNDSDIVIVAPGRYSGPGNRNINFNGKQITLRSTNPSDPNIVNTTIIDPEGKGRALIFCTGENNDSIVTGFTITNGYALLGGAIYCYNNSSPTVANCLITSNAAVFGGAIACTNSESRPKINNCRITANSALVGGGALYCNGASPEIVNCIISGNFAPDGGAIYTHNTGSSLILGCTITENAAANSAGAIYCYKSSNLTINNSILWGNTAGYASEVLVGNSGAATSISFSYCDIHDRDENVICDTGCTVHWVQGNIDIDPQFVRMAHPTDAKTSIEGDYHLLLNSPCIDAGDPAFVAGPDETDIDGNLRILGEKIDIGADEYIPPIPAIVQIKPNTLNLAGNRKWINCSIQLSDSYNVGDIDTATIALNANINPEWSTIDEEAQKLLVKFNYSEAQSILNAAEDTMLLTVTGKLNDGKDFEGTDTIRIIHKAGKK